MIEVHTAIAKAAEKASARHVELVLTEPTPEEVATIVDTLRQWVAEGRYPPGLYRWGVVEFEISPSEP